MKSFNVIKWNVTKQQMEYYNIMPCLMTAYQNTYQEIITKQETKKFILSISQQYWWGRCECEIILTDWPQQKHFEKWDIYDQVVMNIDIITELLLSNIKIIYNSQIKVK